MSKKGFNILFKCQKSFFCRKFHDFDHSFDATAEFFSHISVGNAVIHIFGIVIDACELFCLFKVIKTLRIMQIVGYALDELLVADNDGNA